MNCLVRCNKIVGSTGRFCYAPRSTRLSISVRNLPGRLGKFQREAARAQVAPELLPEHLDIGLIVGATNT
jgi:hypothetical protein